MELKKFQIILDSEEVSMEEEKEVIYEAKKDCSKIWHSSNNIIEEIGLPSLADLEVALPSKIKIEELERNSEARNAKIMRVKNVGLDIVKDFLVNEIWF